MGFQEVSIVNGQIVDGNGYDESQSSLNEQKVFNTPQYEQTGVLREMTIGDGSSFRASSGNTVHASSLGFETGGILDTASNNSFPCQLPSQVMDTTLVSINGMEMTALSAAKAGFLSRTADGQYSEATLGKPTGVEGSPKQLTPQDNTPQVEPFNTELTNHTIEKALEMAAGELGGSFETLDRHALSAISGLTKGDISGAAKNLAISAGVDQGEASEFIQGVYDQFRNQSARYIQKAHKVDGNAVLDWAAHRLDKAEIASISHHIYLGKSSVLDDLARRYIKYGNNKQQ